MSYLKEDRQGEKMELTENAQKVLRARYLLRDPEGNVTETPTEMFRRIAQSIAAADMIYHEEASSSEEAFYRLLSSLRFLPNSPTIMNAGKSAGQLAACFVLPVEDSMRSIFDTLKNAALILQSGGGTGFSFSRLRPRSDIVRSTGGVASGPVSFMKIYNAATDVIKQGGARRGANMGILRVDHPDIIEFVRLKRKGGELSNFNISVAVPDAFMEAVKNDTEYNLVNPRTGAVAGHMRAGGIFDEIVESAWLTGDPGLIFIDSVNRGNPTPGIGSFESTNPCGEQPLLPFEACVLGSLNLAKYVLNGKVDFDSLGADVTVAVHFLDDAIDVNVYPLHEVERMHKGNRKIGLGVMGWADMLILLGLPYNHRKSHELARSVMKFIHDKARRASAILAEKRGVFPNFGGSVYDMPGVARLRNATLTTIAPTGTLSIIAGCSSGIEPLFAIAYKRLILDTTLYEVNKIFTELALKEGFYSEELMAKIMKKGTLRGLKEIPARVRRLFRTALEIPPDDHLEMQAAFQEFTDNAVSKTINLPANSKREDVGTIYLRAYERGLKGITVFRYGSKTGTMMKFSDVD
ncbi:MAG TPA: adenosylcobalamin-dependent ribonucleoside-diphosphate reductase [Dissulfurispiraceae bacterium]|nr:adenosylcobalamin-dependent ribonucleoside-diphosphate reductase [Dissulfurispiraceae bacterium]